MRASTVELRPVGPEAAAAIIAGGDPPDVPVALGYPTEFSQGVAVQAATDPVLGPFFIVRAADGVVVGEIGVALTEPGTAEIGYAIVEPSWGQGHATDAVRLVLDLARASDEIDRVVAHTPLDRPASGRVLEKAGLRAVGETDDEHEGATLRVMRWETRT